MSNINFETIIKKFINILYIVYIDIYCSLIETNTLNQIYLAN